MRLFDYTEYPLGHVSEYNGITGRTREVIDGLRAMSDRDLENFEREIQPPEDYGPIRRFFHRMSLDYGINMIALDEVRKEREL